HGGGGLRLLPGKGPRLLLPRRRRAAGRQRVLAAAQRPVRLHGRGDRGGGKDVRGTGEELPGVGGGREAARFTRYNQAMKTLAAKRVRWTVKDYFRMADAGLFDGRRVELLDGEVIEVSAQGHLHMRSIAGTASMLLPVF